MDNQHFNPDVRLDRAEQAALASMTATAGYGILHRLLRSQVDSFILSLINSEGSDEKDVLAKHKLAKAAAQFYAGVTARVNEEVLQYTAGTRSTDAPHDSTEGVLDIGEPASRFYDIEEDESLGEGIE